MRLFAFLFFASLLLAAPVPATAAQAEPPAASPPPLPTIDRESDPESDPPPSAPQAPAPSESRSVNSRPDAQAPAPQATGTPLPEAGQAPPGTFSLVSTGEQPTMLARGELVVLQAIHGITQGVLVCQLAACATAQQYSGAVLLGGLAGGLGSYFLTGSGISGGMTTAVNAGSVWGFAEGLLLLGALTPQEGTGYAGLLAGSTLLGTAAGVALGGFLHPTGGQVAMTTSGGLWTALLVGLFSTPFVGGLSPQAFFGMELLAANVGLMGFGYLASRLHYSRGRMFLIDVGGLLGMLVGGAAYFFAGLPVSQSQWLGPIAGAGALGGLVGAVLLTANIDVPQDAKVAQLSLLPLLGADGETGLALGGRF